MDMHTERQSFALWVHVVILACVAPGIAAGVAAPDPGAKWAILIPVSLVLLIYGMFTPMTVRVDSERLRVDFGVFGWPKWDFPIGEIQSAEAIEFSPLRDFGGWGIKGGKLGMCLNQRGDRGVKIAHAGRSYIIGSDDPDALAQALHTVGVSRGS